MHVRPSQDDAGVSSRAEAYDLMARSSRAARLSVAAPNHSLSDCASFELDTNRLTAFAVSDSVADIPNWRHVDGPAA